ncbi:sugar-binding protein, partial [Streptomyces sp. SID2131]|nr:sugar-binding protein [Streptomyces sp. SID2131]
MSEGTEPLVRRAARRLRGWGGVAAMAVACGLTASLTLLPLAREE